MTSIPSLSVGDVSLQKYAGEVEIKRLMFEGGHGVFHIHSTDGPLEQILIYENLFRQTLTAEIKIIDGRAITEQIPLIGMERLHVTYKIPQEREEVNLTFRVIDVRDRTPSEGAQTAQSFIVDLVSEERMMNAYQRVSKAFIDPVSTIVEKIYDEYLDTGKRGITVFSGVGAGAKIGTRNPKFIAEETLGNIHYVAPNIHPFDIISNLSQYALSAKDKSTIFCFYENANGFHYDSIHTLFQKPALNPNKPYTYGFRNFDRSAVSEHMMIMEGMIIQNSFPNSLNALKEGQYGASLYTHDIYNKKINNGTNEGLTEYNYLDEFDSVSHTSYDLSPTAANRRTYETLPIGGSKIHATQLGSSHLSRLDKAKKSHIEVYPKHSAMHGPVAIQQSVFSAPNFNVNDIALHRNSQKKQIEAFRISARVAGHPLLMVGECINVNVQSFIPSDTYVINEILSGKYLIIEAVHHFNHTYYHCDLTLIKDSSGVSLDTIQLGAEELMTD